MQNLFKDLVMLPDAAQAPTGPLRGFGGQIARLLNQNTDGRTVAVVDTPAGWRLQIPESREHALELFVIRGELEWAGQKLSRHDYARLPADAPSPFLSSADETRLLLFFDVAQQKDGATTRVVRSDSINWRSGTVAKRDTGQALKLEVKDLLSVEATGQRTWLLRAGADLQVPWERHNSVEEGYLLSGEYRLVECLPQGQVAADYLPGGYFYRPPDIVHSGPDSGAITDEVLWLLRTPTRLDVEFLESCGDG